MKFALSTVAASLLATSALAAPTPTKTTSSLEKRASTYCGQWDSVTTGAYTLYNNLWGESAGTGSQCTTYNSLSGNTLSWSTAWSWAGGSSSVKSYANARITVNKALSAIKTIPSTWKWSITGSNIVADVSYDMFTGTSATSSQSYEIMVWLAALGGAGPISSTGSTPIATPTIDSVKFNLFKGPNGSMTVFSFVAVSETTSFSGDLNAFFTYLEANQGLSKSQVLQTIGAGTEPFDGSNVVLTNSVYSVSVS